jgi:bacillithiol biosynthesis cysteine-adding enzyme BshC
MECSCIRQTELPHTSKLFADLVYNFERVHDLYPWQPNSLEAVSRASQFVFPNFPNDRRAAIVRALTPLNQGDALVERSLQKLATPGVVAIVTGQQVGLFSGPAYTVYKALTAIKIAAELEASGIPAVPVFWLATEDHDLAEVDHAWVYGGDYRPVRLQVKGPANNGTRPVGGVVPESFPLAELRTALEGLPFADEAHALIAGAYQPGQSMGSAFARVIRQMFAPYGLLMIDPMDTGVRAVAAPFMAEAVTRMPELVEVLIARNGELGARGYHAQVLVDKQTSLAFLLEGGHRIALRHSIGEFVAHHRKWTAAELSARAAELSPNALLRPVMQDYLLPTAAYVGGPAELAYLAQSQVLYGKLLGRQPVAFPRAGFTILDERAAKRMTRYGLNLTSLFTSDQTLQATISARLVPTELRERLNTTERAVAAALDTLSADLGRFDVSLNGALSTSRRKIEYQIGKIGRKTASQIMARDAQAASDAKSMSGLVFPEKHLQERLYSIVPFLAKFGLGLIGDIYAKVDTGNPDHRLLVF